jgi:pimeloyl-ACP methyl ester carboxylesterase
MTRNRRRLLALAGLLLLGLSLGLAPPEARAQNERFAPSACWFQVPRDLWIECGYLTVPENRARPAGRQVRLAIAVVHAQAAKPEPDPVVFLAGGPGSSAVAGTVGLARSAASVLAHRDLIVLDQRGTGFSEPRLACPEVAAADMRVLTEPHSRAEKVAWELEALLACGERLRAEGIELGQYHSAASAADLEELRQALGYGPWNLFGLSYGTRLALTSLREQPGSLRSLTLDSVYPPSVHLYAEMPANMDRVLQKMFAGCAADASCSREVPDLEATFYELVARLDREPVWVAAQTPDGRSVEVWVDGSELIALTYRMFYNSAVIPRLPEMILQASRGDYSQLAALEGRRLRRGGTGSFSHGTYFAVQCREEIPFADEPTMQRAVAGYPRLARFFAGIIENTTMINTLCQSWNIDAANELENAPVAGGVPALLLAGEYDPITPPAWAEQAATTLPGAQLVRFPGTGHATITRGGCTFGLIASFLAQPGAPLDTSCAAALGEPDF